MSPRRGKPAQRPDEVVDLARVQAGDALADAALAERPDVRLPEAGTVAAIVDPPRGSVHLGLRVPVALLARVDAHASRLAGATGLRVTRTDAVLVLLAKGLDAVERGGP